MVLQISIQRRIMSGQNGTLNEEEMEDFMDWMEKEGPVLNKFKDEFLKIVEKSENMTLELSGHEKEMNNAMTELNLLREQSSACKRVVDESLSSQDNIRAQVDNFHTRIKDAGIREMGNKNEISSYESKKTDLLSMLEVGSDWQEDQIEERDTLEKERDFLAQKLDAKLNELSNLRMDIDRMIGLIRTEEANVLQIEEKTDKLQAEITDLEEQTKTNRRAKANMEKTIFDFRKDIVQGETDLAEKIRIFRGEESLLAELEDQLNGAKDEVESCIREIEILNREIGNTNYEIERQKKANAKLETENTERLSYAKERTDEAKRHRKETKKYLSKKPELLKKIEDIEKEKLASEATKVEMEAKINHIKHVEQKNTNKENESFIKNISALKRELEILRKKQTSSEKAAIQAAELIQMNKNAIKNLLGEAHVITQEINIDKDKIVVVMREKERFENEAEAANQRYYTALEEVKLQDMQIKELQNKINEENSKLKHKQNLYEAVRSDRNLYSKQLVQVQEEIKGFKHKFRTMNHLIEQLKDEISGKDHAIVKEHFNHHAVDKEKEQLKNEIAKIKKQLYTSDEIVENQRIEVLKLLKIIDEAENERVRQRLEVMAVESEKNLLTDQMVKRNLELKNLYEKIKLMRSNLFIGETQYNKLLQQIGNWQLQLRKVVEDNNETILSLAGFDDLKRTEKQLEREILTEQTKNRALYEELQHPMNIHRWRILESSDPQRFERIKQIQELQKEVISKADEVVQCDLLIQEKEKVYMELKAIISRQPGPEVEEQLLTYQQVVKDKNKQLIAMNDELEMYREQVNTYKDELMGLNGKMDTIKKKWIKAKKNAARQ